MTDVGMDCSYRGGDQTRGGEADRLTFGVSYRLLQNFTVPDVVRQFQSLPISSREQDRTGIAG